MNEAEIKSCPFCGTKPAVTKGKKIGKDRTYVKAGEWLWLPAIKCKRCGLRQEGDSLDDLIQWWNTRRP